MKIRPMVAADKPAVMEMLHHTPEFNSRDREVAEEVIDSYLKDPSGSGYYLLVAEDGSCVAGYVSYGPTPLTESTWDIYWLAVSSKDQRRGVGTALILAAEKAIKEGGGKLVIIETSSTPAYEKARQFYLGRGYEIIARIPDFYSPGDDKVIFYKKFDRA